jgi:hypothetical protein
MMPHHRFAAVPVLVLGGLVLGGLAAATPLLPAAAGEAGPFSFRSPPAGTVLVYSDGFEIAFGKTAGRVSAAVAGPKTAPRAARLEIEDGFMIRRIERGRRLLTIKNTVEPPGFWPLVPGATLRYRSEVVLDGKQRQTQRAVVRIAKSVSRLTLAGKARRVIEVTTDIRWKTSRGAERRVGIVYLFDLDLGYYVKRSYTRYGAEGRPRTPLVRVLARIERAPAKPKR